jgi:type I restriction enzyme M protein
MRRSNCASALQYVPELTWILFLRILDAQEQRDQERPKHWARVSRPRCAHPTAGRTGRRPVNLDKPGTQNARGQALRLEAAGTVRGGTGKLFDFINKELLPHLHSWTWTARRPAQPGGHPKQRIIGRIMTAVERVRVDSETNLRDILDKVHEISIDHIDDQHFFTLSQVYEDLLLKMGEKNSDGGQFFTPREVIRAMVHTVDPQLGRRCTTPAAAPAAFWPSPTSTCAASWATRPCQHRH